MATDNHFIHQQLIFDWFSFTIVDRIASTNRHRRELLINRLKREWSSAPFVETLLIFQHPFHEEKNPWRPWFRSNTRTSSSQVNESKFSACRLLSDFWTSCYVTSSYLIIYFVGNKRQFWLLYYFIEFLNWREGIGWIFHRGDKNCRHQSVRLYFISIFPKCCY